jgi:hypothetical protein
MGTNPTGPTLNLSYFGGFDLLADTGVRLADAEHSPRAGGGRSCPIAVFTPCLSRVRFGRHEWLTANLLLGALTGRDSAAKPRRHA